LNYRLFCRYIRRILSNNGYFGDLGYLYVFNFVPDGGLELLVFKITFFGNISELVGLLRALGALVVFEHRTFLHLLSYHLRPFNVLL
jgi:hypothetical protein